MEPPEAGAFDGDVLGEGGSQAAAGGGRDGLALPLGRLLHSGQFEDRRDEVDDVRGRAAKFALRADARGPVGDEGRADAALVHPGLVTSVRGVARVGEAGPEAEVGRGGAHLGLGVVSAVAHHDLGAGAVVGGEEDEGVLVGAHRLQLGDDASDLTVHAVDHGGVDGHLRRLEAALLVIQRIPGQGAVHLARAQPLDGRGEGIGRADFTFDGGERGAGDAGLLHARVAFGAHAVPAGQILVPVFGDVLRQGVQREVRRDEGHVMEEGLVRVVGRVVLEAVDGMVGRGDGGVVALLVGRDLDGHVVDGVALRREEVALVLHVQRAVEAAGEDRSVDMPFAAVVAAVAGRFQEFGQQPGPFLTDALSAAAETGQRVAVDLLGVVAREQGGA